MHAATDRRSSATVHLDAFKLASHHSTDTKRRWIVSSPKKCAGATGMGTGIIAAGIVATTGAGAAATGAGAGAIGVGITAAAGTAGIGVAITGAAVTGEPAGGYIVGAGDCAGSPW